MVRTVQSALEEAGPEQISSSVNQSQPASVTSYELIHTLYRCTQDTLSDCTHIAYSTLSAAQRRGSNDWLSLGIWEGQR